MKEVTFSEQLATLDKRFADQQSHLEELVKKLKEKHATLRASEKRLYDEFEAIIAREGGGEVNYADGGRYVSIDPSVPSGIRFEYRSEFPNASQSMTRKEGIITNVDETEEETPITDLGALQKAFNELSNYAALVDAAQKSVDVYLGYQTRLVAENDHLIHNLLDDDDDDDKGYW